MFEGTNEIKFSSGTAKKIIGEYLSKLFGVPIDVTNVDLGSYKSTVDVTFEESPKAEPESAMATL